MGWQECLFSHIKMKNFLIKLIAFSAVVGIIDFCWIRFMPVSKHVPHVWMMICFFAFMIAGFHLLAVNQSKGKPQGFIRFYMAFTALRLFLYMLVVLLYRFYDKPTLPPFAIGFMAHYLLFTLFEVPLLLQEVKKS